MQTIKITTAQNIDIDYEVASVGDRILGRLIDMALFIVIFIAASIAGAFTASAGSSVFGFGIMVLVFATLFVFYDLLCEIFMNGQSIGKRLMKIKVISLDGSSPTIGQYFIRWLLRIVDFGIGGGIGALICCVVSERNQRIGDIAAGTTVIKTQPKTGFSDLIYTHQVENYTPVYPQVYQLTDRDINLLQEVIANYYSSRNPEHINKMASKIKDHLGISSTHESDSLTFLNTIIKDYTQVSSSVPVV